MLGLLLRVAQMSQNGVHAPLQTVRPNSITGDLDDPSHPIAHQIFPQVRVFDALLQSVDGFPVPLPRGPIYHPTVQHPSHSQENVLPPLSSAPYLDSPPAVLTQRREQPPTHQVAWLGSQV